MNVRGAAVQSSLAAIGLIAAYTTWQREPERAPGEVVVVDVNANDVQKIRLDDGSGKWVELDRRKEADEPRVWLKVAADSTKKPPTPERELPGNEGATRLWDKFAPLRATRALGALKADKLKELGLDATKKRLEVTARGVKHVYAVGSSPFGVSDPYVKDEQDGRVYVLGGGVIADLESAGIRLVDRSLHNFKPGDWDALVISGGGKTRTLQQPPSENPVAAKLLGKNGKPDDMAKNWHDKLWRMMVVDVLGKGENPTGGVPAVDCKVEYRWRGKQKGFVELGRGAPSQQISSGTQTPPPEIWARSERTAGWDKLPGSADDVLKECAKIAGGE